MKLQDHKYCLENIEAEQLIALPKSYEKTLQWQKSNNLNWRTINFVPNDREELSGSIPGVTVQIDYKLNKRFQETGKTVLTLHKIKQGVKFRAYQLEANDENKLTSHDGKTAIYGTHEHIGKVVFKLPPLYAIEDIANWFKYFCSKINLTYTGSDLTPPQG